MNLKYVNFKSNNPIYNPALRIKITHFVAILILLINAFIFTTNLISIWIQVILAIVVFLHNIDDVILSKTLQRRSHRVEMQKQILKKHLQQAKDAERAKSQFLANMSHEIRTPLNGISGFLQLLQKTTLDKQQTKYLDIVDNSMCSLLDIINNVLDFSKLDSGNMTVELREVNPFIELEKSFMNFLPKAKEKNISYQIHISSNLNESYMMDYLHIHQVMQNLINNSIKFTPENGSVTVKIDKTLNGDKTDILKFSVIDNGIGIAKDNQVKILKAFSQADNSTTRKFGGTGLGLSISKSLIEIMGGKLKINSEEGKGAQFCFELELKKLDNNDISTKYSDNNVYLLLNDDPMMNIIKLQLDSFDLNTILYNDIDSLLKLKINKDYIITSKRNDLEKFTESELKNVIYVSNKNHLNISNKVNFVESYNECPSKLYNSLLGMGAITNTIEMDKVNNYNLNILIAEDYEVNRILISEILNQYKDVKYTFALNGQEAVDMLLEKNTFDIILMDINMPVLDGKEATIKIRKNGLDIPIIALTANALVGDRESFIALGMDNYLSKPINIEELENILAHYSKTTFADIIEIDKPLTLDTDNTQNEIAIALSSTIDKTGFPEVVVLKLFESYINSSDSLMDLYKNGLNDNDYTLIVRSTHNIKSSALLLNLNEIGNLAGTIEENANNKKDFDYKSGYDQFKKHFYELKEYFHII